MKKSKITSFIVQTRALIASGLSVQFLENGFSLCPEDDATVFTDPVSASDAIDNHRGLLRFSPEIVPVKPQTNNLCAHRVF